MRRQGFGCLFGILFLVVVGVDRRDVGHAPRRSVGPLQFVIVRHRRDRACWRPLRAACSAPVATSTGCSWRPAGSRTATTPSGSAGRRSDLRPIQELAHGFDTMAARLEADEEQRRSLLADVSHELRTPLTVITGNLEAIIDGIHPADDGAPRADPRRDPGPRAGSSRTSGRSPCRRPARSPSIASRPTSTSSSATCVAVVRAGGGRGRRRARRPTSPADLPIIDVDPVRIREVIANLVANALRHTPRGRRDRRRGRPRRGGCGRADRGRHRARDRPGPPPARLRPVRPRRASRGSGLGLAIARGLVEAHGGRISVASSDASGTTFQVELPGPAEPDA